MIWATRTGYSDYRRITSINNATICLFGIPNSLSSYHTSTYWIIAEHPPSITQTPSSILFIHNIIKHLSWLLDLFPYIAITFWLFKPYLRKVSFSKTWYQLSPWPHCIAHTHGSNNFHYSLFKQLTVGGTRTRDPTLSRSLYQLSYHCPLHLQRRERRSICDISSNIKTHKMSGKEEVMFVNTFSTLNFLYYIKDFLISQIKFFNL